MIPHPAVGWVRRVLHLDPVLALAGVIGAIDALRDDTFEPHLAFRGRTNLRS
jgi:hypothetical protein